MNALVGIRANTTGLLSPPPAKRLEVAQTLAMGSGAPLAQTSSIPKIDSGSSTNKALADQELDRDAFLQLLVLQLRNQDPLSPIDNQQLLAQLAQFASLEQMNNMNDNLADLAGNIDQLNFISASQMLGRNVQGFSLTGEPLEGVVESVRLNGSIVVLSVGGELMSMAAVIQIDDAPAAPADS